MSLHIIIDGYNMIHRSKTLGTVRRDDLQNIRSRLLKKLAAYKKVKRHRITVVFDGANAPSVTPSRSRSEGIEIHFSCTGESADSVIKQMAELEREKALVVSSDREITEYAASRGSAVISADDFENRISRVLHMDAPDPLFFEKDETQGWIPEKKKKGPDRRLSKKERKNRLKLVKI
ncbi:MAG: NYN domain-containing protein [Thermodesulfobacteriota bacterium]